MTKAEKPCLKWAEPDPRICPEPGNCDKCQIPMAECPYWWMMYISEDYRCLCANCNSIENYSGGESVFKVVS